MMSVPALTREPAAEPSKPASQKLADMIARLGDIPLERVWLSSYPATEEDLFARPDGEKHLFELVDGLLVEKPMRYYESLLTGVLIQDLRIFVENHHLGIVLAPDGMLGLAEGLVRLPDVSFISWRHFPNEELPMGAVLRQPPDLAVEILSPGNTPAEMDRKLREYFAAGTQLVWYVYPETCTVRVYSHPDSYILLTEADTLTGEPLLSGFRLSIHDWFKRAGRRASQDE